MFDKRPLNIKKLDFAFITNIRNKELDWENVYSKTFPLFDKPDFVPPDIFQWQEISCVVRGEKITGAMIVIGSTAIEVLTRPRVAKKQTFEAIEYAIKSGVKAIGFGAGIKKLPRRDLNIFRDSDVIFTHGDSLTATVCAKEINIIADLLKVNLDSSKTKIMIIGAYGTLGAYLANYLSLNCQASLYLVGRSHLNLNTLAGTLSRRCNLISHLSAVKERMDLIITVTNHPSSILSKEQLINLGPYTIIYDPAQPPNLGMDIYIENKEKILRIDGAIVNNPGLKYDNNKGKIPLADNEAFACLAETALLSQMTEEELQPLKNFNLMAEIEPEAGNYLYKSFEKYNWCLNKLKNFGNSILSEEIEKFIKLKINL